MEMSPAALLRLWSLPITLTLLVFISNVPHKASAEGLVCEKGRIPLRTMWLTEESSVCVVPFCGEEEPQTPEHETGPASCMKCDQSAWDGTSPGFVEKTDICPTALGECVKGHCCPKKGDTWYKENFKMDWRGINTSPAITITTYGGSTACGGEVSEAVKYLRTHATGIDDIAAVPSQMYGSWIKDQKAGSQACYVNNNICYKITDQQDKVWTVAIWGKCGGYTQCMNKGPDYPSDFYSYEVTRIDGAGFHDANQCLGKKDVTIAAGTTPNCLSVASGDGTEQNGMNCCPNQCQKHVDWCGSNDHVHFDVGEETYQKICPSSSPCTAKKVEPVLCNWNPPMNPAFGDWTPRFDAEKLPGSGEVKPIIRLPHTEPTCDSSSPPGGNVEDPTEAPPPTSNPSNPDGEQSSTPPSDSAATTGVSLMGWMVASFVGVVSVIITAL